MAGYNAGVRCDIQGVSFCVYRACLSASIGDVCLSLQGVSVFVYRVCLSASTGCVCLSTGRVCLCLQAIGQLTHPQTCCLIGYLLQCSTFFSVGQSPSAAAMH